MCYNINLVTVSIRLYIVFVCVFNTVLMLQCITQISNITATPIYCKTHSLPHTSVYDHTCIVYMANVEYGRVVYKQTNKWEWSIRR